MSNKHFSQTNLASNKKILVVLGFCIVISEEFILKT